MKVEGIWDIIAYDSTPMLYAEDTGSGLVWVQKDPLPAAPILTLPVTLVNDAAKAYLMRLDLGEGPQPYDILDLSAMFQLTSELTYDVSITEMFVLTTDPTTLTGPVWDNRIELNEGESVAYDYLVIATGPDLAFDEIDGLGPIAHTQSMVAVMLGL